MTPTETEHASLKALELYSVPGQYNVLVSSIALSMLERFLETANTEAQITCSELKGDRNKPSQSTDLEFCTQSQGREPVYRNISFRRLKNPQYKFSGHV